ncbi:MAG: HAD-IIA family hydrolase [Anaerolineales bacterium]|nr:HAD-IIA family hydrolase [Anaerolineales bacterium]
MNQPLRGFIFDLDGTVYLSDHALPGAVETIAEIRARELGCVFISNKPLEPGSAYAAKLTRLGIPTTPNDVITSVRVLIAYFQRHAPDARIFVIGEPPLWEEMRRAGLHLTEDPAQIEYVVAAFDRTFDYHKLNIAFQAIKFHNAHFIATNADKSCPVDGGEIPDCAGVIAALEATTGKKVEFVAGKPSPLIIQTGVEQMGVRVEECLIVGDRLETDMVMGRAAGARTALVLTGVTKREHLARASVQPDYVLENIGEIRRVILG